MLVLVLALTAGPAAAFAFHGDASSSAAGTAERAPRWSANEEAMRDTGDRGLAGGLEYAIDPGFCADLSPAVEGDLPCAAIEGALRDAMRAWEQANPNLRFVDVGPQVRVAPDSPRLGGARGAEIDFTAEGPRSFGPTTAAMTNTLIILPSGLRTSGERSSGSTIISADISFNADPACGRLAHPDCWTEASLRRIATHEVGHALGLDHPFEWPRRLETAGPPTCSGAPLRWTRALEPSVMNYDGTGGRSTTLTQDDRDAMAVLYPECPPEVRAASLARAGAFPSDTVIATTGAAALFAVAAVGVGLALRAGAAQAARSGSGSAIRAPWPKDAREYAHRPAPPPWPPASAAWPGVSAPGPVPHRTGAATLAASRPVPAPPRVAPRTVVGVRDARHARPAGASVPLAGAASKAPPAGAPRPSVASRAPVTMRGPAAPRVPVPPAPRAPAAPGAGRR